MVPDIFSNFFSDVDLLVKIENQWVNANSIPISGHISYKLKEVAGNYTGFLLLTKNWAGVLSKVDRNRRDQN